jgi:hypothetical protein
VSEPKRKSEASTNKGQPTDQARRELSEDERKEIHAFRDRKRDRPRTPNARVKSAPRKPLHLDFPSAVEITRFMSAFGTSEAAFANLMLYGIQNAACEGGPKNPPSEQDINRALKGFDAPTLARAMVERGLIIPAGDGKAAKPVKVPGHGTVRLYVLAPGIIGGVAGNDAG